MPLPDLLPFVVYSIAVIAVAAGMIVVSHFLGQRHTSRTADESYESGIRATGTARMRFDVKFYMIAMFFIIFDLESVFIFAWATVLFDTGWAGYAAMSVFIVLLLAMLLYLCRIGALDWGPRRKNNLIIPES